MKKLIAAFVISAISLPVLAEEVVISTGGRGGSYFSTGEKLGEILAEYDYPAKTLKSNGSIENIERVATGEATLGFTQLDALAWWMDRNPDGAANLKVLGNLYTECVYVAVNKKGAIGDEGDLQSSNANVAVQNRDSGSAVSWSYMQDLEPEFAKGNTFFKGGLQLLNEIANNPDGELNAFLWVSDPGNLDQRYLKTVLENDNLKLVDITDWDLNDKHPELGRAIYRFEKPDVAKGLVFDTELKTICMDAVVVANADADDVMLDDVVDVLTVNRGRLFDN
ncbi:TAXI family TRAP transporter solute-binding subunit [Granulosicoccus antarcticus]|uniref:Uncharacterized protein n=1 Tax=Granulosicoccus antarcticus IMCC3135 TaxID=1192854 RepID=A0A2Z2P758_9GAMM|nr:TAXI family TRAP transporter solute-binding subunit [Granulosicoccus antarcticus]ASJ76527.1 hypothetical protein IMCC3135_32410 [Granulosicoccus antarcticus IMCC3135]